MLKFATLLISLFLLAGCGEPGNRAPITSTERDSAGVVIVENDLDTALARNGWTIDPSPALVIGGLDAPEEQQLFQVRGGTRLPDSRIAVMDGGSGELRIFNPDGFLSTRHGRKGEGPGEFTVPRLAGKIGDTLVVYDRDLRRVSYLLPDVGFVRSYQIGDEGGGFPLAIGVTVGGGLAMGGGMFFSSEDGFKGGAQRPLSSYVVLNQDGSVRGDFGDIPAAEMFGIVGDGSFSVTSLPFGMVTVAAVTPNQFWLGTGESWELGTYSLEAELKRIVRFDRPRMELTSDHRAAALQERLENADDATAEQTIRSHFADLPLPDVLPPYQVLSVDAIGNAWIGEFLIPGADQRTYTIVNENGHGIGRVTFPPRTAPLEIGDDYILGLTRDELDVEHVTLWDLSRPSQNQNDR